MAPVPTQRKVAAEKLRLLVQFLQEAGSRGITKKEASAELGVSPRQIDRGIEALEAEGAQFKRLKAGSGEAQRFVMVQAPAWDDHLTHEARHALLIAAALAEHSGSYSWAQLLKGLEIFADQHLSERERGLFRRLEGMVQVQGGVDDAIEPDDEVRSEIMVALAENALPQELALEYHAAGKPVPEKRKVVPYRLTHDIFSGGTFLLAWDLGRKAPRHFRLSRIVKAEALHRPGIIPDEAVMVEAARYQIGGWIGERDPFEIRLRVRGVNWVRALEDAPPSLPEFRIMPEAGGKEAVLSFMARGLEAPTRWLLQFGDAVTVEGPEELKAHLGGIVGRMQKNFGGT
jgi:predicted DNA-binding transcriptional regulator YafY